MPYIKTSDNVEIFYQKSGKGKPIIFVHEFAGDHRSWEPQINFFSRYYNCITYSARGYPPSQVPESVEKYSQERAWKDILDVIDKLNVLQICQAIASPSLSSSVAKTTSVAFLIASLKGLIYFPLLDIVLNTTL